MEGYETLGILGEGTYGVVVKARHRATGRLVAIKRYKQAEDNDHVRKTSLREVRVLKQLRHPNVISLLDVFRRDGKLYLVFEYVENTILQLIEARRNGLSADEVRRYTFQLLSGVDYCHAHNIIHRDVKPENVLVSKDGVLKLCDFGFARQLTTKGKYTDYVATRWYRAPELLVGDVSYGKAVDIWAIGCIFSELSDGQPLFPGDSDLDQLTRIMRVCGPVPHRMVNIFQSNSLYRRVMFPVVQVEQNLRQRFHKFPEPWIEFLISCLRTDPAERPTCATLMQMPYFTENNFRAKYENELRTVFQRTRAPAADTWMKTTTTKNNATKHFKTQLPGTQVEGCELLLPQLAASQAFTESVNTGHSLGTKNLPVSDGDRRLVSPFQPLSALWSQYLGSTVSGGGLSNGGEFPSIGNRQFPLQSSSVSPMRNDAQSTAKPENKGVYEIPCTPLRSKVTENHSLPTDNPPFLLATAGGAKPVVTPLSGASSYSRGSWRRQGTENNQSDQKLATRPISVKRPIKFNHALFPALPSGHCTPMPTPYTTTTRTVALNALSVLREGNPNSVPRAMPNAPTNAVPATNTSTSTGTIINTMTVNAGAGMGAVGTSTTKRAKKHPKPVPMTGSISEKISDISGNTSFYHSVTGHKCSLHDVPAKR